MEKKKSFVPSLKVQGLGLSTLQKENGKTQEENDVDLQLKSQITSPPLEPKLSNMYSQPEPVQNNLTKKFQIPSLKVGGLGFSTLMNDKGKTQEELDVEALIQPQKPKLQAHPVTQKVVAGDSATDDEGEFQINQRLSKRSALEGQKGSKNNDGDGSSSDEYYAEMQKMK